MTANPAPAPVAPTATQAQRSAPKRNVGMGTFLGAVAVVLSLIALVLGTSLPSPSSPSTGSPSNVSVFAAVDSTGSLIRGAAYGASQESTGVYQVHFLQFLDGCSFVAGAGIATTGHEPAGMAKVTVLSLASQAVEVRTFNSSGAPQNNDFYVAGSCPGGLRADVSSNGTYQSGAQVGVTFQSSTGNYFVDFAQNVNQCAWVASLQSGSGTATTSPQAGEPFGVWVNTYDAAGAPTNASFALTVYC